MSSSYSGTNTMPRVVALLTGLGTIGVIIFSIVVTVLSLVLSVIVIIAMWKIMVKAGRNGWEAIIPFYNIWVICEVFTTRNILWFILCLIPYIDFIVFGFILWGVGNAFNKGVGFKIFMILFPWIAIPILGLGKAEYTGDKLPL